MSVQLFIPYLGPRNALPDLDQSSRELEAEDYEDEDLDRQIQFATTVDDEDAAVEE